jgi:hypothetical protein
MEIKVIRKQFLDDRTIGELYLNDKFLLHTLEDKDRGLVNTMTNKEIDDIKINGETACPSGRYRVMLSYSIKLKRFLPLILDVPRGKGVRLHKGSQPAFSKACVLLGTGVKNNKLTGIVEAENKLMTALKKVNEVEPIYITIERNGL